MRLFPTPKANPQCWLFEALAALLVLAVVAVLSPVRAQDGAATGGRSPDALTSAISPHALNSAMPAVFAVQAADGSGRFLGSAFLYDGVMVTNAHVVGRAAQVRLTGAGGAAGGETGGAAGGAAETGQVIGLDALRDVAVIAVVPRPAGAGLRIGPAPALGQPVWAIGHPLGLGLSVSAGIVSALGRQVEAAVPLRLIQHDAAVNPGSSAA